MHVLYTSFYNLKDCCCLFHARIRSSLLRQVQGREDQQACQKELEKLGFSSIARFACATGQLGQPLGEEECKTWAFVNFGPLSAGDLASRRKLLFEAQTLVLPTSDPNAWPRLHAKMACLCLCQISPAGPKVTWLVLRGDPAARSHRVKQFTAGCFCLCQISAAYPKLTWLVLGGDPASRSHRVEQFTTLRPVTP